MTFTLAALFLLALSSAGCLVKEKSDTLCLEPDGSVRWTIVERDIHAVADTPAERNPSSWGSWPATSTMPLSRFVRSVGPTSGP